MLVYIGFAIEVGQIATTESDALDAYHVADDAEQDHIVPMRAEARGVANLRPQAVHQGAFSDHLKSRADFGDEGNSAGGIILGDVVGDFLQVGFDKTATLQPHHLRPVTSAIA